MDKSPEKLRLLAEAVLSDRIKDLDIGPDVNELIHELQVHQIELEMQNEELKKTQLELQTSQIKYYELYNFAPCGYFTLNSKGLISEVNLAGASFLGLERNQIINWAFIHFVAPDCRYKFIKLFENAKEFEYNQRCELELLKDQKPFPVIIEINSYSIENQQSIRITIVDISDLKNAENEIKTSLEEKQVLIREVHHRVKNNLQIIASLLRLQERSVEDKESLDILKESEVRVKSMATIHEKLYQSPTLNNINFHEYVNKLIKDILFAYGVTNDKIQTEINVEDIHLNVDTALPLGLIINELATNSVKYAFPNNSGTITIELISVDEEFQLTISDNGIGLPDDIKIENADTLGLQLVNNLTNQIDGRIKIDRCNGTKFKLIFNEVKYKQRI